MIEENIKQIKKGNLVIEDYRQQSILTIAVAATAAALAA